MSIYTVIRKMVSQTVNLHSSGGSFDALTTGDVQGLLMSCDATPLTWLHFEAKYQISDNKLFRQRLVPWMLERIMNNRRDFSLDYIAKNHGSTLSASLALADCLGKYLTRHKVSNDALSPYFKDLPVEKRTFNRKYAPFIRECVADLEAELGQLERQIKERLEQ